MSGAANSPQAARAETVLLVRREMFAKPWQIHDHSGLG
jgi:hypothetical protein